MDKNTKLMLVRLENETGSPYGFEAFHIPVSLLGSGLLDYLSTVQLVWDFDSEEREWSLRATKSEQGCLISLEEAERLCADENDSVWNQFHIRPIGSWPEEMAGLPFYS